jgi:hypothetical protein
MKVVFPLAVGCCVALWPSHAASQFKLPAPVTQPADNIVELNLEDPLKSQSKCYLDLDQGKTFSYGESTPEDLDLSRQWLRQSGADLMCETRAPSDGFVAYDMVLVETDKTMDELNNFAEVSKQLQVEAKGFNPIDVGLVFPKTYLFRTREGEIGALEISSIDERSHGLQLRYKLIHRPIPQQPPHVERRGRPIAIPMLIEQHKAMLKELQATKSDTDPAVVREKRQIAYLEKINALTEALAKGGDRSLYTLKRQRIALEFNLELARDKLSDDSPTVKALKRSAEKLDEQIELYEAQLAAATQPAAQPATKPVIFVQ